MGYAAPGSGRAFEDASRLELESRQPEAAAIGAPLEAVRTSLLDITCRLKDLLGEPVAPLLDTARRQLTERTCRIAVVGQIKAGKSTFINALARRPGLLPTDVNPWTVVTTALHFRNSPTPPEHAAVFHLFSADEWAELAQGGGRLRELTERLVPGFEADLLRAQLEVMQSRAERRLGAKYAELLGQCHRFATVTPQLLADYVSAGDEDAQVTLGRHYSDITRIAELNFNDGPFAFPITLVDTPGTNDPFLVRDEITRRSLESPDITVFVISACQPLSAADIAMLRLLDSLHKERIVVFINRADQLAKPGEVEAVKAAVEQRLRAELPSLDIPVVVGSARLACLGLEAAEAPELPTLPRRPTPVGTGLAEVADAISRLMGKSAVALLMRQIAVCLAELTRTAEAADRAELQTAETLLKSRRQEVAALAKRVADEEVALAAFEKHAGALLASFEEVEAHFRGVVATAGRILRDRLCKLVHAFAASEADALLEALKVSPRQRAWLADVMPLRERLEADSTAIFEDAAAEIDRLEQLLNPQLRQIVATLLPSYRGEILEGLAWSRDLSPAMASFGDKVMVDIGGPWWGRLLATRKVAEQRAATLRAMIEVRYLEISDELAGAAETHLRQRINYIMGRVHAIGSGLRAGVERRAEGLAKERALLTGATDEDSLDRFEAEQRQRAKGCAERLREHAAILGALTDALDRLDSMQGENGPL